MKRPHDAEPEPPLEMRYDRAMKRVVPREPTDNGEGEHED
jgi:hypothetical protein